MMEDGVDNFQRKPENRKSIMENLSDGVENVKKVMDIVDTFMKFESLDVKMNRLKRKLDVLKGKEDDINDELKYAESLSMKRRKKEVESWLRNVGRTKIEVHQTEQAVLERRGKWLPSIQLHRNLDRLATEVGELYQQGDFSRGLTLEAHETRGLTFPATKLVGQMFQENKNVIWECLRDNNVSIIGIYGMGGVGKTALLTHVNNELVRDCPDTFVSWVTVSQKFTIHKLQDDIANALRFSFSYEDDDKKRAAELSNFLETRKNYVLILDDVWEDVPLDEVGIRVCVNGCKLVLMTRKLDVCRRMDCQKLIRVTPLSDKESRELFMDKLGVEMELTPEIEEIVKSLVKECAGLPLGIITMARSLKGVDDIFEWSNALENMKQSKSGNDDMETKVFQVLKYSYDMLKDPKVQQCFLDCSLYPEDYAIEREDLIDQFIDERLIDGMKSRQAEFYRGHTILNKLVNACLLENVEVKGRMYVKMHDLVRDMALQITSTSPRFLVEASVELKDIPDEEEYWVEDLVKVSLMDNDISNIPPGASPRCPRISTLILFGNRLLTSIPNCFFLHMIGLNVLDLSYTNIENLPNSIFNLANLTALLLKGCKRLKHLPCLANLKALRRLDLGHTGILELPRGLENLANLRYLNLFTGSLQMVPGILINLIRLQHLVLDWHSSEKVRVKGEELARLRRLETVKAQLYHVNDLNTFVNSLEEKELNYTLQVGFDQNSFWKESEYNKIVCIRKSHIIDSTSEEYPLLLPQGIQFLCIESCQLSRSLCKATVLNHASNLRACHIVDCDGIENLLSVSSADSYPLLKSLEELRLHTLQEFYGLISPERDPSSLPPIGTFSSLKDLRIKGCPKMKRLFTTTSISLFQNLEILKVDLCEQMVEIIAAVPKENEEEAGSRSGTTELTLPKLRSLDLMFLPELKSFCDSNRTLVVDSLQEIRIGFCPKLTKLSLLDEEMCHLPSLQKIFVREEWWESLEWDHPNAKNGLQSLCHFRKYN